MVKEKDIYEMPRVISCTSEEDALPPFCDPISETDDQLTQQDVERMLLSRKEEEWKKTMSRSPYPIS